MNSYRKLTVKDAADVITSADSALIVCHTNPDGDAVGSALAVKKLFEALGKRAKAAAPSPLPDYVAFLADCDMTYSEGDGDGYDVIIAVDTASVSQLGELSFLADKIAMSIDHHASSEPFCPYLTVPDASAAGEVIFDVYEELRDRGALRSDLPDAARCLFAAISADTGSFKYSNTAPKTFRTAARLTEIVNGAGDGGLATWDISRLIHDTLTEKDLRINAFVADRIKLFEGGTLAACLITADDMASLGAEERDFGGAIDVVRSLAGVGVALTVRQSAKDPEEYKISSRANADVDVASVCAALGGGGHRRAAGATVKARSPEEAFSAAIAAFSAVAAECGMRRGSGK